VAHSGRPPLTLRRLSRIAGALTLLALLAYFAWVVTIDGGGFVPVVAAVVFWILVLALVVVAVRIALSLISRRGSGKRA
jgi:hypothetical protein